MYDDGKPVRVMDQEVASVKPKQVYMLAYARRDGDAVWRSGGRDGSAVSVFVDDGPGDGSQGTAGIDSQAVASSASGVVPNALAGASLPGAGLLSVAGSPGSARRRLRRKTSEVDEVQLNGRGGSAPGAIGSGSGRRLRGCPPDPSKLKGLSLVA